MEAQTDGYSVSTSDCFGQFEPELRKMLTFLVGPRVIWTVRSVLEMHVLPVSVVGAVFAIETGDLSFLFPQHLPR
jgi:hypothetical protein